jgi:1,4-alpha-glucan branching enzyme
MRQLFFTLFLGLITCSSFAQQDLFNENPIISPEINADHTVTFRIQAPEADQVSVTGSLDGENAFAPITYAMRKGNDGMWTFITPVLPSEFYRYHFIVDSVRTVDPANAHAIRDVGNLSNIFVIGEGMADLYEVQKIPHGTVSY